MAPTLPGCNGRHLDEDFTYRFRDPHRGEIVLFHARGEIGGTITPDPSSRQLGVTKRVIGVPGDTVVGRSGRVFVDGKAADEIPTEPFPSVRLGKGQYFVLGDNRSASEDRATTSTSNRPGPSVAPPDIPMLEDPEGLADLLSRLADTH